MEFRNSLLPIFVGLLSCFLYYVFLPPEYSPVIKISSGSVRGLNAQTSFGTKYYKFLGIPYAKPPERFLPPEPASSWKGIREMIKYGQKCMQITSLSKKILGGEDCLFLNVFMPKDARVKRQNLPVIFHIHGGYFMTGASDYMLPDYFMDENVILVTINYRLNAFGFLNTGDGIIKGNMGLKDQHLALKWVQQNIKRFGGDNEKVTIAGTGTGGASVHYHLLSPLSKDLFSGAVMSSGNALQPWSFVSNHEAQAEHLATFLNCPTDPPMIMFRCLRRENASRIVEAHHNALETPIRYPLITFGPTMESPDDPTAFLSSHPYDILRAGNSSKVPILTGVNSEDGLLVTGRMLGNASLKAQVAAFWDDFSPNFFFYDQSYTGVTALIRQFYLKESNTGILNLKDNFQGITDAFSDRFYFHPTRETVKIQSKLSSVYLYYFTYPLKRTFAYYYDVDPEWPLRLQLLYRFVMSLYCKYYLQKEMEVFPLNDVALRFKFPMNYAYPGTSDFEITRNMVQAWVDFTRDPETLMVHGQRWTPVIPSGSDKPLKYMSISGTKGKASFIDEPFAERMMLWDEIDLPWKETDHWNFLDALVNPF